MFDNVLHEMFKDFIRIGKWLLLAVVIIFLIGFGLGILVGRAF